MIHSHFGSWLRCGGQASKPPILLWTLRCISGSGPPSRSSRSKSVLPGSPPLGIHRHGISPPPKMRRSIVINHLRHTKKCQTELDAWNLDEFGNFTMKSWYSFQDWFDESCNITAGKPEVHPGNNIPNPKQFASGDDTSNPSNPWQGFCWQKHDQFRAEMGYKSQIFLVYVTAVKVMGI